MERAQIQTLTSTEFLRNASAAKRVAGEGNTVIITDRGEPSLALMPIAEYRRLTQTGKNPVELLRMPGADDIDFEPIHIHAQDIN